MLATVATAGPCHLRQAIALVYNGGMENHGLAFYHDPPLWVGKSAVHPTRGMAELVSLRDVAYEAELPIGLSVTITREGVFSFTYSKSEDEMALSWHVAYARLSEADADVILRRTQIMNSFLAFLYSNNLRLHEIDLIWMVVSPDLVISAKDLQQPGMSHAPQRVKHLIGSSFESTYSRPFAPTFDNRIIDRSALLTLDTIKAATEDLTRLISNYPTDGALLVDLYLRAGKSYQDSNYSAAIITSWAITEKLLYELWTKYLSDNKQREETVFIDSARNKRLRDYRTFTAAVVAELLSFVGYIDYDLYSSLSLVRKSRNDWIHSPITSLSRENAVRSLEVCERMLQEVRGIPISGTRLVSVHESFT
jgi:hypothetical protein